MDNNQCYLCGSADLYNRPGSVRDNKNISLLECNNCSLVFLTSFDHIMDNAYSDGIMHNDDIGDGNTLSVNELIKIAAEDDKRRFDQFKNIIRGKDILDFGCGIGGFIKHAKEISNLAYGIELEKRLVSYFEENDLIVHQYLSELNENKYDVITLFHVLEHMPDPRSLLKELRSRLNTYGEIIIEVPNINDALITLYDSEPFSYFYYWSPHLFYYSTKTLEKLAKQSRLKINYIKQFQRYPLSNHLYWLAFNKPVGHEVFEIFNDEELNRLYTKKIADLGKCDTIIASLRF